MSRGVWVPLAMVVVFAVLLAGAGVLLLWGHDVGGFAAACVVAMIGFGIIACVTDWP